jgi:nitrite reductase (NADH) small subunit
MPLNVGKASEFESAGQKVVAAGEREVGIFAIDGKLVGWYNECPHMGGPVCQGKIFAKVIEPLDSERRSWAQGHHPTDRNIVCPWHGVEFDIRTGVVPANPRMRLKSAKVEVIDGDVYLHI